VCTARRGITPHRRDFLREEIAEESANGGRDRSCGLQRANEGPRGPYRITIAIPLARERDVPGGGEEGTEGGGGRERGGRIWLYRGRGEGRGG